MTKKRKERVVQRFLITLGEIIVVLLILLGIYSTVIGKDYTPDDTPTREDKTM